MATQDAIAFHAGWTKARDGLPLAACNDDLERAGWRLYSEAHGHA